MSTSSGRTSSIYIPILLITLFKLLLLPYYHSTDFEVHRNWLSITYHLKLKEWYTNEISIWTLDYPPMFAYLEYILAQVVVLFDNDIIKLSNIPIFNNNILIIQRCTVIVTDFILFGAVLSYLATINQSSSIFYIKNNKSWFIFILITLNFGLLIVDHIHFQYNGILIGLLVYSISLIYQSRDIEAAIIYTILLNMKHLFLSVSLVYFIYLLRHYCFYLPIQPLKYDDQDMHEAPVENENDLDCESFQFFNLIKLGISVIFVFIISFGPFIIAGGFEQLIFIKDRLFPFGRGLVHAYWAPNFWALYNFLDRLLLLVWPTNNLSTTRGLVGDDVATLSILLTPSPLLALSLCVLIPVLIKLWKKPHPILFLSCLVYSSLAFFIFGWHVHEKAIIVTIIPLTLTAFDSVLDSKLFIYCTFVGHFSLFPLLFTPFENLLKISLYATFCFCSMYFIDNELKNHKLARRIKGNTFSTFDYLYLGGLVPLYIATNFFIPYVLPRLEFLPLMLISVYCTFGILYCLYLSYCVVMKRFNSLQEADVKKS